MSARRRVPARFFIGFGIVALLIAGVLSYFASAQPDGLDSVTMHGCTEVRGTEELRGSCIAQQAEEHELAGGPLADYTVQGDDGMVGLAGVTGVLATLVVAGGLFWLLRKRGPRSGEPAGQGKPTGPGHTTGAE